MSIGIYQHLEKSYYLNLQGLLIHLLFLFVYLIRKTNQRQVSVGQFDINFCLVSNFFKHLPNTLYKLKMA